MLMGAGSTVRDAVEGKPTAFDVDFMHGIRSEAIAILSLPNLYCTHTHTHTHTSTHPAAHVYRM